jgi:hypothetical protein
MKQIILFALLSLVLFSTACGQKSSDSKLNSSNAGLLKLAKEGSRVYFYGDSMRVIPWIHEAPTLMGTQETDVFFQGVKIGDLRKNEICSGEFNLVCDAYIYKDQLDASIVLRTLNPAKPYLDEKILYETFDTGIFARQFGKIYFAKKVGGNFSGTFEAIPWIHDAPTMRKEVTSDVEDGVYHKKVKIGSKENFDVCTGKFGSVCRALNIPGHAAIVIMNTSGKPPVGAKFTYFYLAPGGLKCKKVLTTDGNWDSVCSSSNTFWDKL